MLLEILSWLAKICTIGFFLSGTLTCKKMMQIGSTGDVPFLPFLTTLMNCLLWTTYGYLKDDSTLILVNFVGACTQIFYIMTFLYYSKERGNHLAFLLYATIAGISLYIYITFLVTGSSQQLAHMGIVCIVVTIMMQASPLATVAQVIRTKSTESMPFAFSFMITLVSFIWFCYGTVIHDFNIQLPNLTGVLLGMFQLMLFCIYPSNGAKSVTSVA